MDTVLVTGGSGFVGSHVILQLLKAGYDVRTTVRSLNREAGVRAMLKNANGDMNGRLAFFAADLERDQGWAEAITGCDFVIHVASPIPAAAPRTEDELIRPARDGALRVLSTARDARVKRVVMTSSCGAIYYGHPPQAEPFDETSWTNLGGDMSAYVRSKAIAERAAWDFITLVPLLDSTRRATSAKAQRLLGWTPRPPEDAVVATAESLIKFEVVPSTPH
jgi:dihydroflavonol-4-reductase